MHLQIIQTFALGKAIRDETVLGDGVSAAKETWIDATITKTQRIKDRRLVKQFVPRRPKCRLRPPDRLLSLA